MIDVNTFLDVPDSLAGAERADMMEALLRGELSQEEYEQYCKFNKLSK